MRNPYNEWKRYDSIDQMEALFDQDQPTEGGFDAETTGLHLKKDKPFLIVFGWLVPNEENGRVFSFEPTPENMQIFLRLAKRLRVLCAHNMKYDLHMLANLGYYYNEPNLVESMALARSTSEAIPSRDDPRYSIALKNLAVKYVHPSAADAECGIKAIKRQLEAERVKILVAALKQFETGELGKKGQPLKWNKGKVEKFLKDITHDEDDLPQNVREVWREWKQTHAEVTYQDIHHVSPAEMRVYAQDDVISMLEFYKVKIQLITLYEQEKTLKQENGLILPFWRMERPGLKANRDYLEASRLRLKAEIKMKRQQLDEIAKESIGVGQHVRIKQIYMEQWGIELEKTDKAALKDVQRTQTGNPKHMADLIQDLRRLEKWYSTYCVRLLKATEYDGRFYTQINQCSAVSGRVSSDAQQFPKGRILTLEGEEYEAKHGEGTAPREYELFYPRRAFEPTDRGKEFGYTSVWYLDFSQIELRNQANYTLLVSGGDENLCRAYMPFACHHYSTGEFYDHKDPEQRKRWDELKAGHPDPTTFEDGLEGVLKAGWSAWVIPSTNKPWIPTDVHSETTHKALEALGYVCRELYKLYEATKDMDSQQRWVGDWVEEKAFKSARKKGKIFNFLANYGGGLRAAMDTLDLPYIVATALINGYKEAFPHVKTYQHSVEKQFKRNGFVKNMYGRRYMLFEGNERRSYKLANYLVQGTCADMLKTSIITIDNLLKDYESRMILQVHDELVFEIWKGEEFLIPQILQLMEGHDWHLIPIVCDAEVTYTDWSEADAPVSRATANLSY